MVFGKVVEGLSILKRIGEPLLSNFREELDIVKTLSLNSAQQQVVSCTPIYREAISCDKHHALFMLMCLMADSST